MQTQPYFHAIDKIGKQLSTRFFNLKVCQSKNRNNRGCKSVVLPVALTVGTSTSIPASGGESPSPLSPWSDWCLDTVLGLPNTPRLRCPGGDHVNPEGVRLQNMTKLWGDCKAFSLNLSKFSRQMILWKRRESNKKSLNLNSDVEI